MRRTVISLFSLFLFSIIACKSGPIIIETFKAQNAAFDEGQLLNRQLIVLQSPTPTSTATSTSTPTLTSTPTFTPTATATPNEKNTPTATKTTPSPTASRTPTGTATPTSTATATPSPTSTSTSTPTPTATHTPDTSDPPPSRPSVSFNSTRYNVNENGGSATITVVLSKSWDQTITVNYTTSNGSANGGGFCDYDYPDNDYVTTSGQLTFSPGSTSQTFTVEICDNFDPNEPDKTINLGLSNPYNASLGTSSATLVIVNDDIIHVVQFSNATYSVNENGGLASIIVTLNPQSSQTVTVTYSLNDETALGTQLCGLGGDYIDEIFVGSPIVTFPPNSTSQSFDVTICDDPIYEGDETVGLALSNPNGASMGSQQTATLTIVDDELPPTIGFSSPTYNVNEDMGPATITVTIGIALPSPVTVDYATSPGTAAEYSNCQTDVDYEYISDTLTIPAGFTSGTFNVTICDDPIIEPTETLTLTLSNPIGIPLGTIDSAILGIADND